ncbi:unnamed protein product [Choristocarpus tenellus]
MTCPILIMSCNTCVGRRRSQQARGGWSWSRDATAILLAASLMTPVVNAFAPGNGVTNINTGVTPRVGRTQQKLYSNEQQAKKTSGWGNWPKEVKSQRKEQDLILQSLTGPDVGVYVRSASSADMPQVSHICIECFRGPFEWWMKPIQLVQEFSFLGQLRARLGLIKRNEISHACVVAKDLDTGQVVGFLEIGMLPAPTGSERSALSNPSTSQSEARRQGGAKTRDVPYLANVVVDKNQRRRGIGRFLITSAFALVDKLWSEDDLVYVTVEKGNEVALSLYEGMGFEVAALEDEIIAMSRRRPARIYLSKAVERDTKT